MHDHRRAACAVSTTAGYLHLMQWWNEFLSWIQSPNGHQSVFFAAVIVFAIVVTVLMTAIIFRGAIVRLIKQHDNERKNAVIATLIDTAVDASAWNILRDSERILSDRACAQAETHLRLLPIKGSGVAANWVAHELAELKRTSSSTGYESQASVAEFRDRLVHWRDKPTRARKAFLADLERWRFSDPEQQPEPSGDNASLLTDDDELPSMLTPSPTTAPEVPQSQIPQTPAPASHQVVVGTGQSRQSPTAAPAIILPSTDADLAHEETRQLLADVDRLDVPSRERSGDGATPVGPDYAAPADRSDSEAPVSNEVKEGESALNTVTEHHPEDNPNGASSRSAN
ncbi:hypothetical protein C5D47_05755 [Rathayibacter toxicus]|uniref:Uncharacterized protein n=2 Tax=Rathayibacter toxicus TaxID=145458 RepID=A0A2S5Y751_9MICO|nr:hypothetical protein C5D17_05700 [Rathayibacter toxicus]PPH60053.1 hypothetical protein C5C93_05750 [Rathayibacter toxicus]PPH87509.1 hypothetical protein C5D31_05750 [Rathayibacter toxicus]PPI15279.1 hypothetical protein C5C51_05700 [Rathayibacter toxicus]PPI31599.1 hypothetical protein C5D65_05755 [Rathayibacter toxicus]